MINWNLCLSLPHKNFRLHVQRIYLFGFSVKTKVSGKPIARKFPMDCGVAGGIINTSRIENSAEITNSPKNRRSRGMRVRAKGDMAIKILLASILSWLSSSGGANLRRMNDLCLSVLHGAARCSPKKHLSDSENRLNFILPSQSEYLLSCLLLMFASEAERGWRRNGARRRGLSSKNFKFFGSFSYRAVHSSPSVRGIICSDETSTSHGNFPKRSRHCRSIGGIGGEI